MARGGRTPTKCALSFSVSFPLVIAHPAFLKMSIKAGGLVNVENLNVKSEKKRKRKVGKLSLGFSFLLQCTFFPPAAYYLANEFGYAFSFVQATSGNVSTKRITIEIYNISNSIYLADSLCTEVPCGLTSAIRRYSTLQEQI